MAHHIENNEIAYAGETPWHGLGVEVKRGTTGAQMLKLAGLDWQVLKTDLAVRGKGPTTWLAEPVKEFCAITRSDNGRVFQLATQKYQPLQNSEVVDFFREYCEAGNATMETVGALDGGARIWALARLNGGNAKIQGNDELRGYMLMATSHDASLATIGRPTQVRVVCHNTLTAALSTKPGESSFRMLHNTKWTPSRREEAQRVMGLAVQQVTATNELADKLSRVSLDEAGRLEFVTRLIGGETVLEQAIAKTGKSHLDAAIDATQTKPVDLNRAGKMILAAILDSPGSDFASAKNTMWGAVNGATYYADHQRGFSTTTNDSRMAAAWFGEGDKIKSKALQVAIEMTGLRNA